jgi:hypothetical protein
MTGSMTFGGMRKQQKTLHFDNSSMHRFAVGTTNSGKPLLQVAALEELVN